MEALFRGAFSKVKTEQILLLFDYNDWATKRILEAAAGLSQEQYAAPYPVSHGSLRMTLVHLLGAETIWRM
jgi:uncharacterized damage-inducible protein DinB